MLNPPLLIAVMGPTASGKTQLAEEIADEIGAELISADAFQVYRGMDIGTAKPINKSRYHLLDIKDPDEQYGLGEFCRLALPILEGCWNQNKSAVVVGGTGLYLRGLFEEYAALGEPPPPQLRQAIRAELEQDGIQALVQKVLAINPNAESEFDLRNPIRVTRLLERLLDPRPKIKIDLPKFQKVKFGISVPMEELSARIEARARIMVQNGWVREVSALLERSYRPGHPGLRAIGYEPIANSLLNGSDLEEALAKTILETRQYAKRQRTWLRAEPNLISVGPQSDSLLADAMRQIGSMGLV